MKVHIGCVTISSDENRKSHNKRPLLLCSIRVMKILSNFIKRMSTFSAPIENAIRSALTQSLEPVHLEVINESYMHNVPKESESHFKVLVVSDKFESMPLIKRHRLINTIVQEKLEGDFVHALSIEAKTPKQWDPSYTVEPSPNCRGGFGK